MVIFLYNLVVVEIFWIYHWERLYLITPNFNFCFTYLLLNFFKSSKSDGKQVDRDRTSIIGLFRYFKFRAFDIKISLLLEIDYNHK